MAPPTEPNPTERARGRGWALSFAAMLLWAAVWTVIVIVAAGPPDGDAVYYFYAPEIGSVVIIGTPLAYLFGWRRPRPFHRLALIALPVFLVCLGAATRYS